MNRHWVDGVADAGIPADDRGLLYGDGVFRTGLVWDGQVHQFALQRQVLLTDAAALGLEVDVSGLTREMEHAAKQCGRGVLRITLSRLQTERGYGPRWPAPCRRIMSVAPLPARPAYWWGRGVHAGLVSMDSAGPASLSPHKHLNRLPQVLAQRALTPDSGLQEVLMTDPDGRVRCGSMSNLFLKKVDASGPAWITPADGGLMGVSRRSVASAMQRLGFSLEEQAVSMDDLQAAEEGFLANSLIGIWPLQRITQTGAQPESDTALTDWEAPGVQTRALMAELDHPLVTDMLAAYGDST